MKITNKTDISLRYSEFKREQKQRANTVTHSGGDAINISASTRLLQRSLEIAEPFNAERVAEVTASISRGDYVVDANLLARRLAEYGSGGGR